MGYQPAKGSFEYYSPSGKYLGTWGSGSFSGFRALLDSEYDGVLTRQKQIDAITASQPAEPGADTWWDKPIIGPIAQAMFEASKPIQVQVDQNIFLEGLFSDAKAAHGEEQGAYMVFSFKLLRLFFVRATNKAPAANRKTEFVWDLGKDASGRIVMPTDGTQVVIGTVHTHWDDRGREHVGLSLDKDVPSARTNKFVVYAIDRNFLHRADTDGTRHDRLARVLTDILSPALRIYGKSFTP